VPIELIQRRKRRAINMRPDVGASRLSGIPNYVAFELGLSLPAKLLQILMGLSGDSGERTESAPGAHLDNVP
jgi:hypothetical protein